MGRVNPLYTAFVAGEWTPRKAGRVDEKAYPYACKTLLNAIVLPQGGVTKRPGTYFISEVKSSLTATRLIAFQYSTEQAYIIEMGNLYMRFYKNGGQILDGGSPVEIVTPWTSSDIFQVKFVQSADVMYLVHPDYSPRKLSRTSHTAWTLEEVFFFPPPFLDENKSVVQVYVDSVDHVKTFQEITNNDFGLDPFAAGGGFTDLSDAGGSAAWTGATFFDVVITGDGAADYGAFEADPISVEPGQEYTAITVATGTDKALTVLNVGSSSGASDIFTQTGFTGGVDFLEFTVPINIQKVYIGFKHLTTNPSTVSYLECNANIFEAGDVGGHIKLRHPSAEGKESVSVTGAAQWSDALEVQAGAINVSISGTWAATVTIQRSYDAGVTWLDYLEYTTNAGTTIIESINDVNYRIGVDTGDYTSGTVEAFLSQVQDNYGWAEITVFLKKYEVVTDVKKDFLSNDLTSNWSLSAWSPRNGYQRSVSFFEQRLVFGGTAFRPQTIYGSQVGDFENFESGTDDSDAYTYTLGADQVNAILWLLAGTVLQIGTVGGEWRFGQVNAATTPTNVDVRRETTWGSEDIQALAVAHVALYMQRGGRVLRAIHYEFSDDAWEASIVSQDAEHLLRDGITSMAWVSTPDPGLYLVTGAGNLVHMAFNTESGLKAFSKFTTDGNFESVAVIPGADRDEVWVVVNRTIGGVETRFVEQFQAGFESEDKLRDAFYVDSGLSYDGWTGDLSILSAASGWAAGDTSTLTSDNVAAFVPGDVGKSLYLEGSDNSNAIVEITAYTSGSVVTVQHISNIPTSLQGILSTNTAEMVTSVSGLSHLEGKTVAVLVDGAPGPDAVVSGGAITLDGLTAKATVGLAYEAALQTMPLEAGAHAGTSQGKQMRVFKTAVRFLDTVGAQTGLSEDRLDDAAFSYADVDSYGVATSPYTGDVEVQMNAQDSRGASIWIKSVQPLPWSVLAIMPRVYSTDA